MRNRVRVPEEITPEMVDSVGTPFPPKQVIMYYAKDDDPDRLYTIAYLEDATVDRIAKRVVEFLTTIEHPPQSASERKGKKKK